MNDRVTVSEAAKLLGISEGALRQRIHRGSIRSEKDDTGRVYVYLTESDTQNSHVNYTEIHTDTTDLLTELRDRIRFLESELTIRKEEVRRRDEEALRKDHIIMALTNRIPELEAAQDTPPEATESPVTATDDTDRGDAYREPETQSWWRRIFR